jgi:hypothetical protein
VGVGLRFGVGPLRVYIPLTSRRRRRRRSTSGHSAPAVYRTASGPRPNDTDRAPRTPTGRWYFVAAILSAGVLAWLPFFHAARHLGDRALNRLIWLYGAAGVALLALVGSTPTDSAGNAVGVAGHVLQVIFGCLAVVVVSAACVQIAPLRRQVYGLPGGPTGITREPEVAPVDPAVSAVLVARARRVDARALATKDPLMARELRIGRPDLGHPYDDGGLVDLNSAPPDVIARMCQIDIDSARRIVEARDLHGGGFANVEEVFVMTDIPLSTWDRIRDRAVLLG